MSAKEQHIYFIGIKGVGMTMLAQFLASKGNKVSGSDIVDSFMTDKVLRDAKIKVFSPFNFKNIPEKVDMIIHSTAYDAKNNPEISFIKKNPVRFKNVRILSYPEALGEIFNKHYGLAVCGSHGKTTVSAWLGYLLWRAGKKPNVLVGSRVPQFKGSSLSGESKYFVAEVDEYQNKLRYFEPRGVVLNNIDYDHPDFFSTPAAYSKVFADFIKKIPTEGFLIINNSDRESQKIKKYNRGRILSYDLVTGAAIAAKKMPEIAKILRADFLAYDLKRQGACQIFRLSRQAVDKKGKRFGRDLGEFKIALWGEHNVLNALAVIAASLELKVPLPVIRRHLAGFKGTERRAQVLGEYNGAKIIDDYAHHPTEIRATLQGLRENYPGKRIITVFHPHTFTRTAALFKEFAASFEDTGELIILDIYSSARETSGGKKFKVSSAALAAAVENHNAISGRIQPVRNIHTMPQAAAYLKNRLGSDDILLLMGAGDVFRIGETLLSNYGKRKRKKN